MVRVVAHERRHVEVGGDASLALGDEIFEPLVGVFRRAEAGDLSHRPQSAAIHGRIGPPRERIAARQANILERRVLHVERRVHPLRGHPAKGTEFGLALRLLAQKGGDLVLLPVLELLAQLVQRFVSHVSPQFP